MPGIWIPALASALVATISVPPLMSMLYRWNVVDVASSRSSHAGTAVRGLGIATLAGVIVGLITALYLVGAEARSLLAVILCCSFFGAVLGAIEDFRGLSVRNRAIIQLLIAAIASIGILSVTDALWLLGIPATVFIAGYINAANFVDGLDGMSGIHGLVSGLFYLCLGYMTDASWMIMAGIVIAASFVAFLPWNLGRKGTFLGDSGSYLLGCLVSTVAVATWFSGVELLVAFAPTIIYGLDAGGTLVKRIIQGKKWHEAHREFVYQRITTAGLSHLSSSSIVGLFSAFVSSVSLWVIYGTSLAPVIGYLLVLILCVLYWFIPDIIWHLRKGQLESQGKVTSSTTGQYFRNRTM